MDIGSVSMNNVLVIYRDPIKHDVAYKATSNKVEFYKDSQLTKETIPPPPFSWWRHQMETFSALLALCAGNSSVPVKSPHKGLWRGLLMFSLICVWINDWVNNREASDLRRYRGHYDVIVMSQASYVGLLQVH